MAIEEFRKQVEQARSLAEEADDPTVAQRYEQHADLLESVESMLTAQGRLVERKNESLRALAGLILTFERQHGADLEGEASEHLATIAQAAQSVLESVDDEEAADPLAERDVEE